MAGKSDSLQENVPAAASQTPRCCCDLGPMNFPAGSSEPIVGLEVNETKASCRRP